MPTVSRYRFAVLAVFMLLNLLCQTLWISYAPVMHVAESWFGVDGFAIGALSMVFMAAFIPCSLPASWLIDTRGMRVAVGLGGALMAVGALGRGLAGAHYGPALTATLLIAISQPLLLNAWTTLPAHWFPARERASAISLVTFANLLGTALGLLLPPWWVRMHGPDGLASFQLILGAASVGAAVLFVAVYRDRPPKPVDALAEAPRALEFGGLGRALHTRGYLVFLAAMFVGMGVFNGITQWIAGIVTPLGLTADHAGTMGALMLAGGVVGAVALSPISDRTGRRIPFLAGGLALAAPAVVLLAVASTPAVAYGASFAIGLFLVPIMPIGMQYATEATPHTHEGATNGLAQLVGQASVVFVAVMWWLRTPDGRFTWSLTLAGVLLLAVALVVARLREPRLAERLERQRSVGGGRPDAQSDDQPDARSDAQSDPTSG